MILLLLSLPQSQLWFAVLTFAEVRKEGLVPFHVYKITTAPSIVNHVFRRYSVYLCDALLH